MNPQPDPLSPLVARAVSGDRAALEQLCGALQGPMFRLALRVLGDPSDASDATQEILLTIATHLSQFRGESRVLTWSYSIATRHLLRTRKRLAQTRTVEVLEASIRRGLAATDANSIPATDAPALTHETSLGCTNAMLQCLSVEERVALILDELGADDDLGARLCNITETAFRKRLSRARQKLRPILDDLCGLSREESPCRCARQARAKQLASVETSTYKRLPVVDRQELVRTRDALGVLRNMRPIFSQALADPPEHIWAELQRRLPTLLGSH